MWLGDGVGGWVVGVCSISGMYATFHSKCVISHTVMYQPGFTSSKNNLRFSWKHVCVTVCVCGGGGGGGGG